MEKAVASVKQNDNVDSEVQGVHERARAFGSAFAAHLDRLQEEPTQLMDESDCLSFSKCARNVCVALGSMTYIWK